MLVKKNNKIILLIILITLILIFFFGNKRYNNQIEYKYVNLGRYIGLEIEQKEIIVTVEEYKSELEYRLMKFADVKLVKDRGIKDGDLVTITLKEENENSLEKAEKIYEMRIGDNEIDQRLDENLLSMDIHELKRLTICNNEGDNTTLKAGKYSMIVDKIEEFKLPKLTDEFVQKNFNIISVENYKKVLYDEIYQLKLKMEINNVKQNLLSMVIENSKITGYSLKSYNEQFLEITNAYKAYAKTYNLSYKDVLNLYDMSEEKIKNNVLYNIFEDIVIDAIIQKEKLRFTKQEYEKLELDYILDFGYNDIDSFIRDCGERYLEREVNKQIVLDFLYNNAIIN